MKILTFDIEEWFHCDFISDSSEWNKYEVRIHKAVDLILNMLDEKGLTGTFFILGWIAEKYPEVVRKIYSKKHEIACHSYMHELVYNMDYKTFRMDSEKAINILEDIIGSKITIYRAPGFSITENNIWAFEILAELGIDTDCSIFPSSHDYGGFPSFTERHPTILNIRGNRVKEFPINTVSIMSKEIVFSGGGYFRIMPYYFIKRWSKKTDYVMSYFHPRDFDYEQPRLTHLPIQRRFKSYVGLRTSQQKFLQWITDFQMVSIGEATILIDWSKVKTITL